MTDEQQTTLIQTDTVAPDLPGEGIHRNVPFADYAAWPAINSGAVKWGMTTPKHMRSALEGHINSDDTKDRKLGRAIHTRLLEPDKYKESTLVSEPCCALIKSGDRKGEPCGKSGKFVEGDPYFDGEEWFCGTHNKDGKEPADYVSQDEFKRIERIAEAVREHNVMNLFRRPGWSEVSLVWKEDGLTFKARLDRYSPDNPLTIDLKKCQVGAGDRDSCQKSICDYGWYRQAAIYVRGVEALTGTRPDFVWVFIEDNEPYDVNVIPIDEETYEIGKWEVDRVISAYKRCLKDGNFYGYIYDPKVAPNRGGLPNWKRKEFQGIL